MECEECQTPHEPMTAEERRWLEQESNIEQERLAAEAAAMAEQERLAAEAARAEEVHVRAGDAEPGNGESSEEEDLPPLQHPDGLAGVSGPSSPESASPPPPRPSSPRAAAGSPGLGSRYLVSGNASRSRGRRALLPAAASPNAAPAGGLSAGGVRCSVLGTLGGPVELHLADSRRPRLPLGPLYAYFEMPRVGLATKSPQTAPGASSPRPRPRLRPPRPRNPRPRPLGAAAAPWWWTSCTWHRGGTFLSGD